ncbi:MAG TPA: ATP-dependent RecD-like DNA helicase [Lachnospiraceae bacterium]|nr:ATP-dependent RecD-like DNA helicase [Lachnospiraceae bacterium]
METEKGYIGHFTFKNEDESFTVFDLVTDGGTVVCVGPARGYGEGEMVEVTGEYVVHPLYKRQLKISSIKEVEPEDTVQVERYLGSGAIKGIGEALAKRIVKMFGDDTFRIAQEEPERLAEVKGISLKKAYDIGEQIARKRDMREAMMFMQEYGISQNLGNKIYQRYGAQVYKILKENPYRLAEDIDGVGFKIADEIASKVGIDISSEFRIRCGLIYTLNTMSYDGNCYYPKDELFSRTAALLDIDTLVMDTQLQNLAMDHKVVVKVVDDVERVYLPLFYREETKCADKLLELRDSYDSDFSKKSANDLMMQIEEAEKSMNIELDMLQKQATVKCLKNGVFILSGGPGTGKTTTINMIIRMFEEYHLDFMLAAPTGRAAKRMTESTGYEARTIHRLLEVGGDTSDGSKPYFDRNEDNPLEVDAIIVDEMSMVDIHLMVALLNAIEPGTKLVLVGDVDQLPSVGPGQILRDILLSECFESEKLEKIFRQDNESHIVSYAYSINKGQQIDFSKKYPDFFLLEKNEPAVIYDYIEVLIKDKLPKQFNINPLDTQILTPMRKGAIGVEVLNPILQARLNPPDSSKKEYLHGDIIFREGDKVMQIKNDYNLEWEVVGKYNIPIESGTGVFNGDVGKIAEINTYIKEVTVEFDDGRSARYSYENMDELEHAYAVTIHKSQGSEYPVVILPILPGPRMLMSRNLLYTGITRAKECVIIIGSSETVGSMISQDMIQRRYTSLNEKLIEISKRGMHDF